MTETSNPDGSPERPRGALAELEHDAYSRQRFFKLVGGVGAAGAFSSLLAACGGDAGSNNGSGGGSTTSGTDEEETSTTDTTETTETSSDASGGEGGDLEIVNYALTLEYLEADFYRKVVDSGLFSGAQLDLIKAIGDHEQAHVDALKSTAQQLGEPAQKPQTQFPIESKEGVLDLAATVENLGAAAYLGQAAKIQSKDILAAALAIHTVEARHAAALNKLTGKSPTPDGAFAKPLTMDEVLSEAQQFIVS